MAHTAHKDPEMVKEFEEDEQSVDAKAKQMAEWIKQSKHLIFFTGAGVSTSAGIPDFRGPEGAWTLAANGQRRTKPSTPSRKAIPTPTHMAIVGLMKSGYGKFLISQNTDGLHRKSGVLPHQIAELHGNSNLEICRKCGKHYMRDFPVTAHNVNGLEDHMTGRRCVVRGCNGYLYDSIINFGENLPQKELKEGFDNASKADLCLSLGSSLTVVPAADMPKDVANHGRLVIVNLQKTPLDSKAALRVFSKTDVFLKKVMHYLGLEIPEWRLHRRLMVTNTCNDKGENQVSLQGLDFDETPVSFLQSASCNSQVLSREPFLFKVESKNLAVKFELEFMGHYAEPNLEFEHKPESPTACKLYSLEYNAFDRTWKISVQDAKPLDFTYMKFDTEEKKETPTSSYVPPKGASDMSGMFVVEPIDNCPHLATNFKENKTPIGMLATGIMDLPCKACGDKNENWICLECFQIGCSRYVNSHQEAHYKETGHCIAVSFSDLSVWCYQCESYIRDYSLRPLLKVLSDIKFGDHSQPIVMKINGQTCLVQRTL